MTEVMRQPATYEDLLKVPEHLVAEIIDGELFTSPRPAPRHSNAESGLLSQLRTRFHDGDGGPGGWWILVEPELHLGRDVLVPDVAGWRRERLPALPETAWFDVAPEWICEVLSSSNAPQDRFRKMPRYAGHGVEYAWNVDPVARGLEVYRRQGDGWYQLAMHHGKTVVRAEPFEASEINLGALWID